MPSGYTRLNERSQRPNTLINFIKPIDGPDKAIAEDLLNRIAAQCYPVMKAAHISVMSLEEFPHNNEFLGRNFNAGECIQLVLKDRSGRWLGFKFVQMVMMHELAHCSQMNHSKYFWQVRNQYAQEMYDLWAKKYHGEGVWGRGQHLTSGSFVMDRPVAEGDVPEHLCGGTYRRRGRKRKRGTAAGQDAQRPSYAERQQKRIAKKFGKHGDGNALGEDELVRGALEQAHRHQGKPRVAGSKRGRELRAQAALARFESAKTQQTKSKDEQAEDSDTDWSDSDLEDGSTPAEDDNGYVKICDGEEGGDEDANNEMKELQAVTKASASHSNGDSSNVSSHDDDATAKGPEADAYSTSRSQVKPPLKPTVATAQSLLIDSESRASSLPITATTPTTSINDQVASEGITTTTSTTSITPSDPANNDVASHTATAGVCSICSLENEPSSLLCLACAHVLRPRLVSGIWRCQSSTCKDSAYLNAGDSGRCGICGGVKPTITPTSTLSGGMISADVLRWD